MTTHTVDATLAAVIDRLTKNADERRVDAEKHERAAENYRRFADQEDNAAAFYRRSEATFRAAIDEIKARP